MSLEYAPKSALPWHSRRRARRTLVVASLSLAIVAAWRLTPFARDRANEFLVLRRCLHFTAAPDRIAFDADRPGAAALLKDTAYRDELNRETAAAPVASYAPPAWVALLARVDPTLRTSRHAPPLVFLHERVAATGERRLLILRYLGTADAEAGPATHAFEYDLLDPRAKLGPNSLATRSINLLVTAHPVTRLYFGHPDADDASRFTFRYETEQGAGTIDGSLIDRDTLRLEVRDGPEKSQ